MQKSSGAGVGGGVLLRKDGGFGSERFGFSSQVEIIWGESLSLSEPYFPHLCAGHRASVPGLWEVCVN